MNGIKWLLDTNFIIGLLKADVGTLDLASTHEIDIRYCGYSVISRMELLGFPGLGSSEESIISEKLASLVYVPLSRPIEDEAIRIRRKRRVKLPDAIIAATGIIHGAELLTHDKALLALLKSEALALRQEGGKRYRVDSPHS
jgi:predicted nucleic acid-binding protein